MPILIYQPGKVASVALKALLEGMGKHPLHAHYIHNITGEFSSAAHYKLRDTIMGHDEHLKIITPVRDPIDRNLSAYMWGLPKDAKYYPERYTHQFINVYRHEWLLNWFDFEYNKQLDFDVHDHGFEREQGYSIYRGVRRSILILRVENFNTTGPLALHEFLGIPMGTIPKANRTKHWFYEEFKAQLVLPLDFLDKIYSSKYTRTFYTVEEIEHRINYWSEPRKVEKKQDFWGMPKGELETFFSTTYYS